MIFHIFWKTPRNFRYIFRKIDYNLTIYENTFKRVYRNDRVPKHFYDKDWMVIVNGFFLLPIKKNQYCENKIVIEIILFLSRTMNNNKQIVRNW